MPVDRQTDNQVRLTDTHKQAWYSCKQTDKRTKQTKGHADRRTDRPIDRQTDKQAGDTDRTDKGQQVTG